jgi:hypothetical protein
MLREAAQHLLQQFVGELGTTLDAWHRGRLEQVIAELQAFLEQTP